MGFKRKVKKQGGKPHRKATDTKAQRAIRKLTGKTEWYKKKKEKNEQKTKKIKNQKETPNSYPMS